MSAEARARAYTLWSRLVLDGLTDELLPTVRALPALAEVLPAGTPDQRAAAHLRVLSLDIQPYESVFLSKTGLLGGDTAEAVARDTDGLQPRRADAEPDHLGMELGVLARLSAGEAADGHPRWPALAARFLDQHLLRWLPPLVLAMRAEGDPFWTRVTEMALELAASHRSALPGHMPSFELSEPPPLLEDPKTGLKRIAEVWTRPAWAGLFLVRPQIASLTAEAGVPGGFGTRKQQLEAALFTASDHGELPALLAVLDRELRAAESGYAELSALGVEVGPWTERLARTRRDLVQLRDAAASGV